MFQISALPSERFSHLYGLSDEDLDAAGVVVRVADAKPGYPCRVTLRDAEPGTRMLLLNYEHQDAVLRMHTQIGIDDFAAVHYVDGEIHAVVATRPDATASVVTSNGRSGATVTELATMLR